MKSLTASLLAAAIGITAPVAAAPAESSNFSLTYALDLDSSGNIVSLRPMASPDLPAIEAAVESEVRGWTFSPAEVDGKAVPTRTYRRVVAVSGSHPDRQFTEAAESAARSWRFVPELADGKPVGGTVLIPVCFKAQSAEPTACDWTGPDGKRFTSSSVSVAINPAARITSELAIVSN